MNPSTISFSIQLPSGVDLEKLDKVRKAVAKEFPDATVSISIHEQPRPSQ